MFWIWAIPDKYPNKRIGEYIKGSSTDRFVFRQGKVISEAVISPKIVFECSEKYLSDVLPNSGQLIVVSTKVLDILQDVCPQDIQVFDANVFVGEKKIPNYYLINIVNAVEVINKEASEFTTIKGTNAILGFEKIVYKVDGLGQFNLVRNADYHSHILVSDYIKKRFEKEKIKGVQFN
ncbi:imm11 family protein [Neobacillus sp. NRS-1170]|uniref:imm11 family protein n=1 Tax=Neobacillus sp. NRS-1170 TaxID=3233898 RepID=UPI003D28C956